MLISDNQRIKIIEEKLNHFLEKQLEGWNKQRKVRVQQSLITRKKGIYHVILLESAWYGNRIS